MSRTRRSLVALLTAGSLAVSGAVLTVAGASTTGASVITCCR